MLGAALKAAVDQVTASAVAAGSPVDRDQMFLAMGNAIIAHILAFGVLSVAGTAVGVTAGPAAVPVTGSLI